MVKRERSIYHPRASASPGLSHSSDRNEISVVFTNRGVLQRHSEYVCNHSFHCAASRPLDLLHRSSNLFADASVTQSTPSLRRIAATPRSTTTKRQSGRSR